MTWESTGEVRTPKKGDYYWNLIWNQVTQCHDDFAETKRVIMRPVQEPKEPIAWNVVIPFSVKHRAQEELRRIQKELWLLGHIEEIYE